MAKSLRVGVLLPAPVQLLDASAIDLFGMLTPEYLEACKLPAPLTKLAIPVSIEYIGPEPTSSDVPTAQTIPTTSSACLPITATFTSPSVQPGKLDVLLMPGPDPSYVPPADVIAFLKLHQQKSKEMDFLVICTGSFTAGYAGLLDGKNVTAPRGLLGDVKKKFPKAKFGERRWERDGRIWSSGGITNGLDMTAAYLHSKVSKELADLVCAMAEVGDRGQDYGTGNTANTLWWLSLILVSAWKGLWRSSGGKSKSKN